MKINKYTIAVIASMVPSLALAKGELGENVSELIGGITNIIGTKLIPLFVTLALVVFFYRIVISIYKVGDNPKAVAEGKTLLFWGVMALFVMVSIWGITGFISDAFGIKQVVPQLGNR
jgi:hypothetical protein